MTVQELIDRLNELSKEDKAKEVLVGGYCGYGDPKITIEKTGGVVVETY